MIIDTISFSSFCDGFSGSYKDNFSYEGKRALFDYLENSSEELGEDIEFDPVAICCDYSEFENFEEYKKQYPNSETVEDIENNTIYIPIEGTERFIIQSY